MTHSTRPRRNGFFLLAPAAALFALMAATPAVPQQTPAKPAPAKPAAASTQAAPAPAAPPPVEAAAPIRTVILAIGNWTVTCREFAPGGPRRACQATLQMTQQGQNGEQGSPLLTWTIAPDAAGKPAMTLQTPTGVMIAPGVELTLGKAAARRYAFTACEARCATAAPLDDALGREIRTADSAQVVIISTKGDTIRFTFPIVGADKALSSLN